ncbi:uncharacterized protein Dana_GF15479 [Drosophila ananassae]|uniref:C2H2-type domain-containing protein n=1 Tax=Drosophila ananassae TaxID=7217 RepID=B3ML67_DROAN|nr:uncharacterized protein LOC6498287 [Drosophila ananassae]EDV31685.2 uncharacterized protein Dana_GF15479 [Drosophila ananassae]
MDVGFGAIQEVVDICDTRVKMEPDDVEENDLTDSGMEISNAEESMKIIEESSHMITVPVRDTETEDERRLILNAQQLFQASSAEDTKTFECHICHFPSYTERDNSAHLSNHQKNLHFCLYMCGVWVNSLEKVLEHEYRYHSQPGSDLSCRICDFSTQSADKLANHMENHSTVYRFVCSLCRRDFESSQDLRIHRKVSNAICGRVQFKQTRAELVASSKRVFPRVRNNVLVKTEPHYTQEWETCPPIIVKTEPDDEQMSEMDIKQEIEPSEPSKSIWSNLPVCLRGKLRLPALPAEGRNKLSPKISIDNMNCIQQTTDQTHKKPIAMNILKSLPTNCMSITLPSSTKIRKIEALENINEPSTVGQGNVEESSSTFHLPKSISIRKVQAVEKSKLISTPVAPAAPEPPLKWTLPKQLQNRNPFEILDAYDNLKSKPESMKMISDIRNKILSIEKTLPLPGTVLQSPFRKDGPKPVEVLLDSLSSFVMKELREKFPNFRFLWSCPICPWAYEKNRAFRTHLSTEHSLKPDLLNKLKVSIKPYDCRQKNALNVPVPSIKSLDSQPQVSEPSKSFAEIPTKKEASPSFEDVEVSISPAGQIQSGKKKKDKPTTPKERISTYQCSECSKVFTTHGALRIHKTIHTGELPYKCDFCDKRFRTPGQVRVHHRRHTGEKPFKCKFCSLEFTHRETLISHISRHIGMKRYKCYGCDKNFVVVSGLRAHRRIRPDTCGKVKFTARAHGPRVRVIKGEVVFESHPEHNGYLRSEDPLNILSERGQVDFSSHDITEDEK